jgi:molybdenum cofactor cytidylyltransferase
MGLGNPLSAEFVHRHDRFAVLAGLSAGEAITPQSLTRVLLSAGGGLKGVPPAARRVVLLNQADSSALQSQARGMAAALLPSFDAVIVASLEYSKIHAVHEPAAAIVLAAGASTRLGRPKQLLDWHGQPFVHAVAATALAAGLSPVVVVVGAGSEEVQAALQDLPVKIVNNESWQSGQASSIQAGLRRLPASTGATLFLLSDQPQVSFDVLAALVDMHAAGLYPIVAPLVRMEQRANPVLFDRAAFPDLLSLQGDVGGRAVFSKHRVEFMPWHDDRLLLDVDTEADYRRLVEDDTL